MTRAIALLILMGLHGVALAGVDETYNRPGASIWSTDFYARIIGRNAFRRSVAVVVGVGDYDSFPRLSAPAGDALRVRDFLRDEAGFDQIIMLTDEKATQARIEELMEQIIPDAIGPNDRFLFYFSGHGATRPLAMTKRGYLVLKKSARGNWQDMIDMQRVQRWTENVAQARHALFLLDACFSGLAALETKGGEVRDKTIARLMQPGHHIVTAGTEGEETFVYKGESLFTQAFLAAARGDGMAANDGIVSLNEIIARVNRILDARQAEIGDRIRMTPRQYYPRITNNSGEFFFLPQGRSSPAITTVLPSPVTPVIPKGPGEQAAVTPSAPATGSSAPPILPPRFEIRSGMEAKGTEAAAASYVRSIGECELRCTQTAICRVFTFARAAGTGACYLYSRASLEPNQSFDSGISDATALLNVQPVPSSAVTSFALKEGTEAIGAEAAASSYLRTIGECEQKCAQTGACKVYTFARSSGACYLYSRASLEPNPSFDSAFRDRTALLVARPVPFAAASSFTLRERTEAIGREAGAASYLPSRVDCETKCSQLGACKVITFSPSNGACYLYSSAELSPNVNFESGFRDPSAVREARADPRSSGSALPQTTPVKSGEMFDMRSQTEASGSHTHFQTATSIAACAKACMETSSCRIFSYARERQACYLYSQASLGPNAMFVTGIKNAR